MKKLKELVTGSPIITGLVVGGILFVVALVNLEMNGGERYSDMTWWGKLPALILMVGITGIGIYVIVMRVIGGIKKARNKGK